MQSSQSSISSVILIVSLLNKKINSLEAQIEELQ